MNVCGTNSAMSKGLYLIARKIASRWEYASEWEGGDPTLPAGQGLPTTPSTVHSSAPQDDESSRDGGSRRQRGGQQQRSGGRGGRERGGGDLDRYERDGGRHSRSGGDSDRRGGGDRGSSDHGGRDGTSRYGRGGGRDRDGQQSSGGRDKAPRSGTVPLQTTSAPWITDQPSSVLASALGAVPVAAPAAPAASAVSAAASAEAWQKLLGQIPATARESLGIGTVPVSTSAAADVFGQFAGRAAVASATPQQQQLQQPAQVCFVCAVVDVPQVVAQQRVFCALFGVMFDVIGVLRACLRVPWMLTGLSTQPTGLVLGRLGKACAPLAAGTMFLGSVTDPSLLPVSSQGVQHRCLAYPRQQGWSVCSCPTRRRTGMVWYGDSTWFYFILLDLAAIFYVVVIGAVGTPAGFAERDPSRVCIAGQCCGRC